MSKNPVKRIKDLPPDMDLRGVRFKRNGVKWYWYSQWQKGIWAKKNMKSDQVFPIFVGDIKEVLEFEVVE